MEIYMKKEAGLSEKKIVKRLMIVFSFIFLVFLGIHLVSFSGISAKSKKSGDSDLEKCNISWDLEKGKVITGKRIYTVGGEKRIKIRMTKYKVKNLKNGNKKISFTLKFYRLAPELSEEQKVEMYTLFDIGEEREGHIYCTLADYKSGLCLEKENKYDVKVVRSSWNSGGKEIYYPYENDTENWFRFDTSASVSVTLTCPPNYKDLVILAGCYATTNNTEAKKYYEGDMNHSESLLYKSNDKLFCHGFKVG